jgi:hypothetical protein
MSLLDTARLRNDVPVAALLQQSKAYYVATSRNGFRPGIPAEILGIGFPPSRYFGLPSAACFHLRYEDGHDDYAEILPKDAAGKYSPVPLYAIISETQKNEGLARKLVRR